MSGLAQELQLGIALLAFTIAFYALVGREHKTPYITARALSTVYWVLVSLLFLALGRALAELRPPTDATALAAKGTAAMGRGILVLSYLYLLISVFKVANRRAHFRDDIWKNFWIVRQYKAVRRLLKPEKYHYDQVPMAGPLLEALKTSHHLPSDAFSRAIASSETGSIAAALRADTLSQADQVMVDLAERFLANKGCVQYATCARHPSEFLSRLRASWKQSHSSTPWDEVRRQVVAIDAYSPHFGFTDTVHPVRLKEIRDDCLALIRSAPTYAGLHTAASQAFNRIKDFRKEQQGQDFRNPALVIYEAPHALVDLESAEQYRIFVRHVLPSERMWGGMFTVFVEPCISDDSWKLLVSYADFILTSEPTGGRGSKCLT